MFVGYHVIWVLEELVHRIPPAADVYVMYDIACTLVQHLKGRNVEHLLKRISLLFPPSMPMATMLLARYRRM